MEKSDKKSNEDKFTTKDIFDIIQVLLQSIAIIAILFVFFFRISTVNGSSMNPTLQHKDILVLSTMEFEHKRGDIVVVSQPNYMNEVLIKRIVGLPGEVVDINSSGKVTINGTVLDESYTSEDIVKMGDIAFPHTVKEGCVFVMGDNRNASTDSRFAGVGDIDVRYIVGQAKFRVLPLGNNFVGKEITYNVED